MHHLGCTNICYKYTIGGKVISIVDQYTDLSISPMSEFSYTAQINAIITKAPRCTGMLFRAFSSINNSFLTKLFPAYVWPIFQCGSVILYPTTAVMEKDKARSASLTKRLSGFHYT